MVCPLIPRPHLCHQAPWSEGREAGERAGMQQHGCSPGWGMLGLREDGSPHSPSREYLHLQHSPGLPKAPSIAAVAQLAPP